MERNVHRVGIIVLCLILVAGCLGMVWAAGKPNVTRHEAKFLENSVNMHVEWQSPNPVTLVKISLPGIEREITVDPYDNRRNPDGYSGEVNVTLGLSGLSGPSFNYVMQLQDELRIRSEPVTGQVRVPVPQQPGMPPGMMPPPGMAPPPPGMAPPLPPPFPADGQGGQLGIQFPQLPGSQPGGQPGGTGQ